MSNLEPKCKTCNDDGWVIIVGEEYPGSENTIDRDGPCPDCNTKPDLD